MNESQTPTVNQSDAPAANSAGGQGGQGTSQAAGGATPQTNTKVGERDFATVSTFKAPLGLERFVSPKSGSSTIRPINKKAFLADQKAAAEKAGRPFVKSEAMNLFRAYYERTQNALRTAVINEVASGRMVPANLRANKGGAFTAIGLQRPARVELERKERAVETVLSGFHSEAARKLVEDAIRAGQAIEKASQPEKAIEVGGTAKVEEVAAGQ